MNPEDIARLITEDPDIVDIKCPTCGAHGAYIGFNTIECPNPNCRHYSKKQAFEHQREVMKQESWCDLLINYGFKQVDHIPGGSGGVPLGHDIYTYERIMVAVVVSTEMGIIDHWELFINGMSETTGQTVEALEKELLKWILA